MPRTTWTTRPSRTAVWLTNLCLRASHRSRPSTASHHGPLAALIRARTCPTTTAPAPPACKAPGALVVFRFATETGSTVATALDVIRSRETSASEELLVLDDVEHSVRLADECASRWTLVDDRPVRVEELAGPAPVASSDRLKNTPAFWTRSCASCRSVPHGMAGISTSRHGRRRGMVVASVVVDTSVVVGASVVVVGSSVVVRPSEVVISSASSSSATVSGSSSLPQATAPTRAKAANTTAPMVPTRVATTSARGRRCAGLDALTARRRQRLLESSVPPCQSLRLISCRALPSDRIC